jgi:(p)ppGpp synthase/HD superfamily hydrolase
MKPTTRFEAALTYATHLHRDQTRKGTDIPYVGHLLGVASLVIEDGGSEDEAIAGLLHDAVEDQGGAPRLEDIRTRFGVGVAAIVAGCTDADTIPKPPWRQRKEAYLAHLREATADVLRVSAADKFYNARAILEDYRALGEALWPRFSEGRDEILWYYRSLVAIFLERGPVRLAGELARAVAELNRLTDESAASAPLA